MFAALSGCIRTVPSDLPSGDAAYTAIKPKAVVFPLTYPLVPGDTIQIQVFQEPDLSVDKTTVDPAGSISLPLVGEMRAGGLTAGELGRQIEAALGRSYMKSPHVSVVMIEPALRSVAVEGEVKQPGVYGINGNTTLIGALALARSPTLTAKLNEVMIFRQVNGERVGARFDIAMIRAGKASDPVLLPDDVVVVGFGRVQGTYRDFLSAAPIFNIFTRY